MRIVDVRATPVFVPMHHPLRASLGIEVGLTRVIVELLTDEGLIGLGESNGGSELASAVFELRPLYMDLDPMEVATLVKRFSVYHVTSEQLSKTGAYKLAGAAIEMAFWDLMGKMVGKPCAELWGGRDRDEVEFAAYVFFRYESLDREGPFSDPAFVAEYALELCEKHGFRDVKLKNGVLAPDAEIDTVRRIREQGASRVRGIRVDPNQAWSVATSIRVLDELKEYGLEFCEDPTWGLDGMQRVRERTGVPLATNMCCISFDQLPSAIDKRALDIILGDIHFWGGPTAVRSLAKICETFGLGLSLHSDRELGISTAAVVHMAAATPMINHAIDSHLPEQAADVITEPFVFKNGALDVPTGPGLGVELDRDAMQQCAGSYEARPRRNEFLDELRPNWRPHFPQW
jgi:glucarate dehydratase